MLPSISLPYGRGSSIVLDPDVAGVLDIWPVPAPVRDLSQAVTAALDSPIEFPPLRQCVYPGDRIALVLERFTPGGAEIVAGIAAAFEQAGVSPADVTILQPADYHPGSPPDPRAALPDSMRRDMQWEVHDPVGGSQVAYLASTTNGERVYLSRSLVDADTAITVGPVAFDPLLGYSGTSSIFYPGLSTIETFGRFQGEGHAELGPDDPRPIRQMIDEIAWLLGNQFTLQVVPTVAGRVASVIGGMNEPVLRAAIRELNAGWRIRADQRYENVVVTVDAADAGTRWSHVASAVDVARRLVQREGRIVVLSELAAAPEAGVRMLMEARSPREILKRVRETAPPDLLVATQLVQALEWANVSLLSRLDADVVESLFMQPIDSPTETQRLLATLSEGLVIPGAQRAYGEVRD
jgi:nickel-dependent lactate racemase